MKIRRSITTALAASALVVTFGLAAPAAHARSLPNPVIQINPCVLDQGSCSPTTTTPGGPGTVTTDPCVRTVACPPPSLPPAVRIPVPPTTDPGTPATPAIPVKTTASFTG